MAVSSELTATLVDSMGSDDSIVRAMLVSTKGAESLDVEATPGRINFLMANRHGTPFEHNSMTFFVRAPIFVFREFHRHRIGWSYNEVSGRYKELDDCFYVPPPHRPLVQEGKPGAYEFVLGTIDQYNDAVVALQDVYTDAYNGYRYLLNKGVAKEVARALLPVGIYTEMYATCNARSLMAFLSLRTRNEGSKFPSYPQWEIEQVARQMEEAFAQLFPITYVSFVLNGRVAP
ncbi:MAG: FAD-dependent thymidylate synthase [Desulfurellales bacterium]|nr:MAG: FAD-dependent thymidylate synthase [Desulfurellales bacterium]